MNFIRVLTDVSGCSDQGTLSILERQQLHFHAVDSSHVQLWFLIDGIRSYMRFTSPLSQAAHFILHKLVVFFHWDELLVDSLYVLLLLQIRWSSEFWEQLCLQEVEKAGLHAKLLATQQKPVNAYLKPFPTKLKSQCSFPDRWVQLHHRQLLGQISVRSKCRFSLILSQISANLQEVTNKSKLSIFTSSHWLRKAPASSLISPQYLHSRSNVIPADGFLYLMRVRI